MSRLRALEVGNRAGIAAGIAVAIALDSCTASSSTGSAPPRAPTSPSPLFNPTAAAVACRSAHLKLGMGSPVSEATQQESRVLTLTNMSSVACHLKGYPKVSLIDKSGEPNPFRYRDGGDQMVTSKRPKLVALPAGGVAWFMFNKTACVARYKARVRSVEVTPPGGVKAFSLGIGVYPIIAYCGRGDPGSIVDISPIEPTERAVLAI